MQQWPRSVQRECPGHVWSQVQFAALLLLGAGEKFEFLVVGWKNTFGDLLFCIQKKIEDDISAHRIDWTAFRIFMYLHGGLIVMVIIRR